MMFKSRDNNAIRVRPLLVLDDHPAMLEMVHMLLDRGDLPEVHTCANPRHALKMLSETPYSVLLLDLVMPGMPGQTVLEHVIERYPETVVVMLTGTTDARIAVECMKKGAFDYLVKPVEGETLVAAVHRALRLHAARLEADRSRARLVSDTLEHPEAFATILTENSRLIKVLQYIESIAVSRRPVLITGETGTGKGMVAKALYRISRCPGPFVPVNVAGLDDSLFADTLFGHSRGAFTGADSERGGLVEQAARGILFLDEMGDLSLTSQVKLLRLLEEGEYHPLGSDAVRTSSARIVCATNRDLDAAVARGEFRRDLYFRLRTHCAELPPLRQRRDDIPLLVHHFVQQVAEEFGKTPPPVPGDFFALLDSYDFPGNVRELEGLVAEAVSAHRHGSLPIGRIRTMMFGGGRRADVWNEQTPAAPGNVVQFPNPMPTLEEVTEHAILEALARSGGNKTSAASLLGISRTTLNNRLRSSARNAAECTGAFGSAVDQ